MKVFVRESRRAVRPRIVVRPTGRVEMVVPRHSGMTDQEIRSIVSTHWHWIVDRVEQMQARDEQVKLSHPGVPVQVIKRRTQACVESYIASLQEHFPFHSIVYRTYRSRWGRCTSSRKIGFDYRLSLLPREVGQYIIVHELAHLSHMNHGSDFWREVQRLCPGYKIHRKMLKNFLL